jgi:hypothetical protein
VVALDTAGRLLFIYVNRLPSASAAIWGVLVLASSVLGFAVAAAFGLRADRDLSAVGRLESSTAPRVRRSWLVAGLAVLVFREVLGLWIVSQQWPERLAADVAHISLTVILLGLLWLYDRRLAIRESGSG